MSLSFVTLAVFIVAAFCGGGAYFGTIRAGAGHWLAFAVGLLVHDVVVAVLPAAAG